jgi:type II restriction enzyme
MAKKNQSSRLTQQHKSTQGAVGIFGEGAKSHDKTVGEISELVFEQLKTEYSNLEFRYRSSISKDEINQKLKSLNEALGQTLFVSSSNIRPDGGIIEVKDDEGGWRVILVTEAKHQGKDIENIQNGKLVGKNNDQDLMTAGNAIERSHKNIAEIANFMLNEAHFPYILFLEGSHFLTETVSVKRPDGRVVKLKYSSGILNRLDRLTAANYGLPINTNLCPNRFIEHKDKTVMLQAASLYTQGNGAKWNNSDMFEVMMDISRTSLKVLESDLFKQITESETTSERKTIKEKLGSTFKTIQQGVKSKAINIRKMLSG